MDWLRWRSQRLSACFSEPRIRSSMRDLLVRYNEWVILRYAWAEATTVLQTLPCSTVTTCCLEDRWCISSDLYFRGSDLIWACP
jgi:hypothetical protein